MSNLDFQDKLPSLKIGAVEIFWLDGGKIRLDGGPMFGPVPKVLWSKKIAPGDDNCIEIDNSAMLLITPTAKIIIDSGIGNKMTEKQLEHFHVQQSWQIPEDLSRLELTVNDIDFVIPTHADFDHAGGLTCHDASGNPVPTFPKAQYIFQEKEWNVVKNPDRRSATSYWPENFASLKEEKNLKIINGDLQLTPEVKIFLTGGHTIGHQGIEINSQGESAVHLGDLLPSRHHLNPLWVIAYDDYPMEVIAVKERRLPVYARHNTWILFYHDTEICAGRAQFAEDSQAVTFSATINKNSINN